MTRTLTITDPALVLAAEGDRFALRRGGETARQVRTQDIGLVVLSGPVTFTAGAAALALRRGIDVVLLTGSGRFRGRLSGPESANGQLRAAQARLSADPVRCLPVARAVVRGKLLNQRALLLQAQKRLRSESVAAALARLRRLAERADASDDVARLRGLEGDGAARYFGTWSEVVRHEGFPWNGRNRRPPRDPLNACLSFGYTLLGVHAESAVRTAGLDVSLGVFHDGRPGTPSLVLDLIEEFRPLVVDAMVLRLVNRRQLAPPDFETVTPDRTEEILAGADADDDDRAETVKDDRPAVLLGDTGRRIFFREFHRKLREKGVDPVAGHRRTYADLLQSQAWQFARIVTGKADGYRPVVRP